MSFVFNGSDLYERLEEEEVEYLYHANTVRTAATFLRRGALLSRGTVEGLGLDQTDQKSDDKDKNFGLWYDLFLDTGDISEVLSKRNKYGPVKFKIDTSILKGDRCSFVWVTKKNPIHWKSGDDLGDRFITQDYLDENPLSKSCFWERALVLRHCGGRLPFGEHLKEVIIDDPYKPLTSESEDEEEAKQGKRESFVSAVSVLRNAQRGAFKKGYISKSQRVKFSRKKAMSWYVGVKRGKLQKWFAG